jgi:hypothetical protein
MTHMRDPTRTSSTTATVSPLMEDPYCQGLISEHPFSDIRPARIVSDARLSTTASDSHRLHYITFHPYLLHIISYSYMYLVDPGVGRGPYQFSHHTRLVALLSCYSVTLIHQFSHHTRSILS